MHAEARLPSTSTMVEYQRSLHMYFYSKTSSDQNYLWWSLFNGMHNEEVLKREITSFMLSCFVKF